MISLPVIENGEADDASLLNALAHASDESLRSRLAVYGAMSFSKFRGLLRDIRFIRCEKFHEFNGIGAAGCELQKTNGLCAHQRKFRSLEDRNALTIMEDAVRFAHGLGRCTAEERDATFAVITAARRVLEQLDLTAAQAKSALSGRGLLYPEIIGLPAGTSTLDEALCAIGDREDALVPVLQPIKDRAIALLRQEENANVLAG